MPGYRSQRVNEEIRRELSDILRALKDPGIAEALPSIVRVEATRDLAHAKVFISFYGGDENTALCMEAIRRASGFMRHELAQRLDIRRVPQLLFKEDDSIAYAVEMSEKIDRIVEQDERKR